MAPDPSLQPQRATLLGVERSLSGKRWEARLKDERRALTLSQRLELPEAVGRILAARGVSLEDAPSFLEPTLRDLLPNPSRLAGMDEAVARLSRAIAAGERVAVFGDYDVDGATSSALLARFFRAIGQSLRVYIPDRLTEGYGPNPQALRRLAEEGVQVLITVDCGISAHDALEAGRDAGLDVIVVDHHAAETRLPPAAAIVNPNRLDDDSGLGHLAAVGVTFLLVVALNRALREADYYGAARPEPNLMDWLDLVALGTVCDVVALKGLNRAFVKQGLKVMAARRNAGLRALSDVAGVSQTPETYHLGFVLGPRVNAGGRVGRAGMGAELLAGDDPAPLRGLAQELDAYNEERKAIEAQVLDQALQQVEQGPTPKGVVFAVGEGWHPGVIGIVASRLKERYNLPAFVVALDEQGVGKGSGRSVPGVDLGAAIIAARQAELLINGGGHPMAAGITVAAANLPELKTFLETRLLKAMVESDYQPALGIDAVLGLGAAKGDLLEQLSRLGPYGVGNPEPRFAFEAVKIVKPQIVGQDHVKCFLEGRDGARLRAISFRSVGAPLGERLLNPRGLPLHLAGKLKRDDWVGGDAVQLHLEDAADA